jgi:hypothetical protein
MATDVSSFNDFEDRNKRRAINYDFETEEVLGPLPQHWEKAEAEDGRFYFVE